MIVGLGPGSELHGRSRLGIFHVILVTPLLWINASHVTSDKLSVPHPHVPHPHVPSFNRRLVHSCNFDDKILWLFSHPFYNGALHI
jgi:hypothetical protein